MGFAPRQLVALRENKQLRPESPGIFDNRFDQFLVRDFMKGPRFSSLQRKKNARRLIQVQVEAEKLRRNSIFQMVEIHVLLLEHLPGSGIRAFHSCRLRSAVQPLKRPTDRGFQGICSDFVMETSIKSSLFSLAHQLDRNAPLKNGD